jgi:N-acetyl-anhydromuramyl-L-alanine amidase AmpD
VIGHIDWTVGMQDGTHTDPGTGFPWDLVLTADTDEGEDVDKEQVKEAVREVFGFTGNLDTPQGQRAGTNDRMYANLLGALQSHTNELRAIRADLAALRDRVLP